MFVSDGSTDKTAATLDAWCAGRENANVIRFNESRGKSAALQAAWKSAPGAELTAIYDADVQPRPESLRLLASQFADPRVGAVAGLFSP